MSDEYARPDPAMDEFEVIMKEGMPLVLLDDNEG
jgi:hypothetical protein